MEITSIEYAPRMSDPNLEKTNEIEGNLLGELELINQSEISNIRLEGQALDDVLSQIDRPVLIQ